MSFDTKFQPDPVCPSCGHKHRDAWEWKFPSGDVDDFECEECEETMTCERIVTVEFRRVETTEVKP